MGLLALDLKFEDIMSIQACRDARCAETLFLSDARVADNTPVCRQFQRALNLSSSAFT